MNAIYEWDSLIKSFNALKYTVTDRTDKEFIRSNITLDEHYDHCMDQTRMITGVLTKVNLNGAKGEELSFPVGNQPLS